MKKTMRYLSMAALALVGAMMTGCSSDDFESQPAKNVITVTTTVDLDDSDATRSLSWEGTPTKSMNKTFAEGETMAILYKNTSGNFVKAVSNALTDGNITSGGKSATFTFDLENPDKTYPVEYVYPASMLTDGGLANEDALSNEQDGTLATLASKFDYCSAMNNWVGDNLPSLTLTNRLAILAITLKDNAATPNDITSTITGMTLSDGTYNYSITRTAAAGPIFVAIRPTTTADISYTATDGTHFFVKEVTNKTYESNHVYPLGLRMATSNTINLARLSADFTAQDGQTLTGTLGANVKISIAANASVTLDNATINGVNSWDYEWAGITCLGDATIILSGTNSVKGFQRYNPGIQAAHNYGAGDEFTLTIQGTGSLAASSNGEAAGIGGGPYIECGNITISGGTITATGGDGAAGIGSGSGRTCGNITISNGTVTATGGENAAGIGGGTDGASCENISISGGIITATGGSRSAGIGGGKGGRFATINITGGVINATGGSSGAGIGTSRNGTGTSIEITSGVTSVTATKGSGATNSIGAGEGGLISGTVTIGGVVGAITESPYTYPSLLLSGQFTINGSGGKVQFSRGNLKRENGTWSFHTNQYGYLGFIDNNMCDLFYWETTGNYGSGLSCVTSSGSASDVVDWGTNMGAGWKTLTKDEWVYLFNTRTNASSKYGHGRVNGLKGMIILPDSWTLPDGLSFTAGNSSWTNSYNTVQWSQMEAAGAVFLPAVGYRDSYGISSLDIDGYYWSSSPNGVDKAYSVYFYSSYLNAECNYQSRNLGCAVRLVKDAD